MLSNKDVAIVEADESSLDLTKKYATSKAAVITGKILKKIIPLVEAISIFEAKALRNAPTPHDDSAKSTSAIGKE